MQPTGARLTGYLVLASWKLMMCPDLIPGTAPEAWMEPISLGRTLKTEATSWPCPSPRVTMTSHQQPLPSLWRAPWRAITSACMFILHLSPGGRPDRACGAGSLAPLDSTLNQRQKAWQAACWWPLICLISPILPHTQHPQIVFSFLCTVQWSCPSSTCEVSASQTRDSDVLLLHIFASGPNSRSVLVRSSLLFFKRQ